MSEGRKQFLAELKCLPVTGYPALFLQPTSRSPIRSVTSCQTDDAVSITSPQTSIFFSTPKPFSYFVDLLLRGPLVDLPVASCRNRGAATVVLTVCSEHISILHHISDFIYYVYVFLMSVDVNSVCKQYGSVIVLLFHPTSCYTLSTIYKYMLYQSNYKNLCILNIDKLSLNINIQYCHHK
jgi:hypothetical protein